MPPRIEIEAGQKIQPNHKGELPTKYETNDKTQSQEGKDQIALVEPQIDQIRTIELGDGVQMEFVYVPAGEFWMGADENDWDAEDYEKPKHKIYLDGYWIGRYPATNEQYARYIQETNQKFPDYWKNGQIPINKEDHPVIFVRKYDAENFTKWLSQKCNKRIKLPTEAQWEKAARGPVGCKYPWGDEEPNANLLNYDCNIDDTTVIGSYPSGASPYGALDMAGNVWEWVADWYGENYYNVSPPRNPTGPGSGDHCVLRGGSWYSIKYDVRSSYRFIRNADDENDNIGFRCAALN